MRCPQLWLVLCRTHTFCAIASRTVRQLPHMILAGLLAFLDAKSSKLFVAKMSDKDPRLASGVAFKVVYTAKIVGLTFPRRLLVV
jgi:hypothetical protein